MKNATSKYHCYNHLVTILDTTLSLLLELIVITNNHSIKLLLLPLFSHSTIYQSTTANITEFYLELPLLYGYCTKFQNITTAIDWVSPLASEGFNPLLPRVSFMYRSVKI